MKGSYCLVQFCPDASRSEAVNVGVTLLCPEKAYFDAKIANANDRIRRLFQIGGEELERVDEAKEMFYRRLQSERGRITNIEALERFRGTRANEFLLTAPRTVRVETTSETLTSLFEELVGGRTIGQPIRRVQRLSAKQTLHEIFSREEFSKVVRSAQRVQVPHLRSVFFADYEFQNGQPNLIRSISMQRNAEETVKEHARTILSADLIQKHHLASVTVVMPDAVAGFEGSVQATRDLLSEYEIESVNEAGLEAFAERILATAH